jgi:hypothetical protein
MLRLRPEQFEALKNHSQRAMEKRVAAALTYTWPVLCRQIGAEILARRVALSRRQAAIHGIQREVDVLRFARLALIWGDDFANSAQSSWAAEILAWKNSDAVTRLDALEGRSELELGCRPEMLERLR